MMGGPRKQLEQGTLLAELDALVGDNGEDDMELWAENLRTVEVFSALGTQWNVGMGGLIGLRYEAVPIVLHLLKVPRAEWGELFDGLRIMERAALDYTRH